MQAAIYLNLLTTLKSSNYRHRTQNFVYFSAQKGKHYNNELMVVGRAVNGWLAEYDLESLNPEKVVTELFSSEGKGGCPLSWVIDQWGSTTDYNTKKSAFWRVISQLCSTINSCSEHPWSSEVVWSNLYKVAPAKGGNPSDGLCYRQLQACDQLLKEEIREYRPKTIVFLTGLDWFEGFLAEDVTLTETPHLQWVDAFGELTNGKEITTIVIAKHPQGKPEADMVKEIFSCLGDNKQT